MALDGGGGGPVGSANSFTGTASSIEAMGNGVWAGWSGLIQPAEGTAEALNFLSPNKGLIADMGWFVNFDEIAANKFISFAISLNGTTVASVQGELSNSSDWSTSFPFVIPSLIIPSQSEVIVLLGTDATNDIPMYVTLVGKEI